MRLLTNSATDFSNSSVSNDKAHKDANDTSENIIMALISAAPGRT